MPDVAGEIVDIGSRVNPQNRTFVARARVANTADQLRPGGAFALWSDDPPEERFMKALEEVFESCEAEIVRFHNPHQDRESASTVYVARKAGVS